MEKQMNNNQNTPPKKYFVRELSEIQNTEYPPIKFYIENLIPDIGLVILAGAPKVGKSWFILQMLSKRQLKHTPQIFRNETDERIFN